MLGAFALWFMLFLPMMIGCMCCGTTETCGDCTVNGTWRIVVTGISADCDSFNGTFDLTLEFGTAHDCTFRALIDASNYWSFGIFTDGTPQITNTRITMTVGGGTEGQWDSDETNQACDHSPWPCTLTVGPLGSCTTLPGTLTATAV